MLSYWGLYYVVVIVSGSGSQLYPVGDSGEGGDAIEACMGANHLHSCRMLLRLDHCGGFRCDAPSRIS